MMRCRASMPLSAITASLPTDAMARFHLTLLGMLMIASCSAQPEPQSIDKQLYNEIERFLDGWNDAMIAADTTRLGDMMDDNIILRHISGMTQTKSEWLEEVASGSMNYHKIEKRDVKVSPKSESRTGISFTSVITATIWGSHGTWTLHGEMLLERRNGQWVRVE